MNVQEFLDFGLSLIKKSRHIINRKKKSGYKVTRKMDQSFVSDVDRDIEKMIREEIFKRFPRHRVVGEEFGVKESDSEYEWVVDPIDGTLSFVNDIPLYGTIIGLYKSNLPVVGIIDIPEINKCYYAGKGMGTYCGNKKLWLEDKIEAGLKDQIIAIGDLRQFEVSNSLDDFKKLVSTEAIVRTIPDCFGHSLAITGAVGAMIDYGTSIWDFAATKLLIEEAGGNFVVKDKFNLADGSVKYNIICGKGGVVNKLLEILKS